VTATAILTQLQALGVNLSVVVPNRLRVEAPVGVVTPELRTAMLEHKEMIISVLGVGKDLMSLLSRRCPFCKGRGMRTDETERDGLRYFDTSCLHCGEVVETFIPPRQNLANVQNEIG
jgi:hypothetical protein